MGEQETLIDNRLSNLLLFLCQHPMTILSRDELINEVWKGLILTDQVITQAIFELRKILKTNQKHLHGYIITIPKRGYKLDIKVQIIPQPINQALHLEDNYTDKDTICTQINQYNIENKAVSQDEITNDTLNKITDETEQSSPNTHNSASFIKISHQPKKTVKLIWSIVIIAVISSTILLIFISQFSFLKINQPLNNNITTPSTDFIYNTLEPRSINAIIKTDVDLSAAQIEHGIIFKVVEYLKYKLNLPVSFYDEPHNNAAKELTFIITEEDGIHYINVEYFNRISQSQHLDRKYEIDKTNLKPTIKRILNDILISLNVKVNQEKINDLLSSIPNEPQVLLYALEALSTQKTTQDKLKPISLMKKALKLTPNNPHLLSNNYIYSMIVIYLDKSRQIQKEVSKLNQDFEHIIPILSQGTRSDKANEALAMNALSRGRPIDAIKYITDIPYTQQTVITYILKAKLSESLGNPALAEEYYYQAIYESKMPMVLEIAESLFFHSDLSKMKNKLEAQIQ
ncbi:winged helix-turn-helix domain-containing protein [Shewanella sp. VB17]|uniref:winged helix-turn-helix domain-containing protein n=1 Tax=Shewanella sp. VB17 TaxID=2739432 RepID=UPI001C2597E3|nr:winged helix-turn-helix domain-containing protein [Shewanella sp. VB17]